MTMRKGWECPKCGRIWAPWVKDCSYCNNQNKPYIRQPLKSQPTDNIHWKIKDKKCPSCGDVSTNSDQCAECGRSLKEKSE